MWLRKDRFVFLLCFLTISLAIIHSYFHGLSYDISDSSLDIAIGMSLYTFLAIFLKWNSFLLPSQSRSLFLMLTSVGAVLSISKFIVVILDEDFHKDVQLTGVCVVSITTFFFNGVSAVFFDFDQNTLSNTALEPLLLEPSAWQKYRATKKALTQSMLSQHFSSLPLHTFDSSFQLPPDDLPFAMKDILEQIPAQLHDPLIHSARVLLTLGPYHHPTDLSRSKGDGGWTDVMSQNGVFLQRRPAPAVAVEREGRGCFSKKKKKFGTLWRESCVVAMDPARVVDLLKDVSRRPDWDRSCVSEEVIARYTPQADITLTTLHGTTTISHRILCCLRLHFSIQNSDLQLMSPATPLDALYKFPTNTSNTNTTPVTVRPKAASSSRTISAPKARMFTRPRSQSLQLQTLNVLERARFLSPPASYQPKIYSPLSYTIDSDEREVVSPEPPIEEQQQQQSETEKYSSAGSGTEDVTHVIVFASVICPKVSRVFGVKANLHVGGFLISPFSQMRPIAGTQARRSATRITRLTHMSFGGSIPQALADFITMKRSSGMSLLRHILYRDLHATPTILPEHPTADFDVEACSQVEVNSTKESSWNGQSSELAAVSETEMIESFNSDPFRGIHNAIRSGFCDDSPESIAKFLFSTTGLNRKQIGMYLGSYSPTCQSVLRHYTQLIPFQNLFFDDALRVFLKGFSLPREAQMIDRIMEQFAIQYVRSVGEDCVVRDPETAHILAFSVIMLNTDLHSKVLRTRIHNHMTVDQFIQNNRGINRGENLPVSFLTELYQRVQSHELRVLGDNEQLLMFLDPHMQGWLRKEGGRIKTQHNRWCVLKDCMLFYFRSPDDSVPTGIIPLENVNVREAQERGKYAFELFPIAGAVVKSNKMDHGVVVSGSHDVFVFRAADENLMRQWIVKIRAAIFQTPIAPQISWGRDSYRLDDAEDSASTKAR
eukprot:c3272_g1_i1.p1 GENE.c3272_g1_i1~~c3272_g1_i1.p1  ORF type:complete len:943 (+),score=231.38 c3272_g1_i1:102-2930(+)